MSHVKIYKVTFSVYIYICLSLTVKSLGKLSYCFTTFPLSLPLYQTDTGVDLK